MASMTPLANAPNGFVWAWPKGMIAHLVGVRVRPVGTRTMCGRNQSEPRVMAFQVGGYSATPCKTCVRIGA